MKPLSATTKIVAIVVAVIAVAGVGTAAYLTSSAPSNPCAGTTIPAGEGSPDNGTPVPQVPSVSPVSGVIKVVAAENFWGSLVSQLGGNHTSVLSIVTDPNTDPHEYEANDSDAVAIAAANYVIVNGVGYDDWAIQLIAADNTPNQLVLNVGLLNGVSVTGGIITGNPHQWYNPVYVNRTLATMFTDLVALQPSSFSYFAANYATINASLASLYGRAAEIRSLFAGTVVESTESIFVYLANYTGLDLISPPAFMEAIAEGNDPPTQSVVTFECQLESGQVKVLIYNEQTVTPITTNMKAIAAAHNVTIVGVTETIQPPGVSFQTWMNAEYLALQNGLNSNTLGQ
jgi:zinc/manganese transport system substrate-binding protein